MAGVFLDRFSVVGVSRVGGCSDQLVAVGTAAVLGGSGPPPGGADRPRYGVFVICDGFKPDTVLPVVTEIVGIEQLVADLDQHLVEAHLVLGNAGLALLHLERTQIVLRVVAVVLWPTTEPMQMTVGPAERSLDNVVEIVEEQVGRELKTTPQRRFGSLEIDTDPIGDDVKAAWAPS